MAAYNAADWSDLYVACAGAAAALAGLLFVAVSINLERILAFPDLPDRALETLAVLLGVLLVSVLGLAPGQGRRALGTEFLVVGVVLLTAIALLLRRSLSLVQAENEPRAWLLSRFAFSLPGAACFAVGGISLLAGTGGGLYWVFAGIIAGFLGAVSNAWVLLVEIHR